MQYLKGKVSNATGAPIAGASVFVSDEAGKPIVRNGTTIIRATDERGVFLLPIIKHDTVTVAHKNYQPITLTQYGSGEQNITLQSQNAATRVLRIETIGLIVALATVTLTAAYFLKKDKLI